MLAGPTFAARVRSLGLADLTTRAGRIFVGECVSARALPATTSRNAETEYIFTVITPLKGVQGNAVRVVMPGTPKETGFAGLMPFEPGERALLFLYAPTQGDRCIPMGFDQGRFWLERTKDGVVLAANGRGNDCLLQDVPIDALGERGLTSTMRGPLALDAFETLVRELLRRTDR